MNIMLKVELLLKHKNKLKYMNCTHKTKVAYELTEVDKADFGQRLEDFLGSDNYEKLAMNFLTPTNSLRGHRAKSML